MKFSPITLALAAGAAFLVAKSSKGSAKSAQTVVPIKLTETSIEIKDHDKAEQFYHDLARKYLNSIHNDLSKVNYIDFISPVIKLNSAFLKAFNNQKLTDAEKLISANILTNSKNALEIAFFGTDPVNNEQVSDPMIDVDEEHKKQFEQWQNEIHPQIFDYFNKFIGWNDELQKQISDVNKSIEQYGRWPLQ